MNMECPRRHCDIIQDTTLVEVRQCLSQQKDTKMGRERGRVALDLLMGKNHQDISHSNILELALQVLKEEEAALCIGVLGVPVVTKIAVHDDSLGVAEDVAVPVQPRRLLGKIKHGNVAFLEHP
jgi:hypothetical protein